MSTMVTTQLLLPLLMILFDIKRHDMRETATTNIGLLIANLYR